jgi:serine/threonine protein kinase/class 3 adenylate cyclase
VALVDFTLLAPLGSGEDGTSYLGVGGDGARVVVHLLKSLVHDDDRRAELAARRNIVGLVGRGTRTVIEDALRAPIPYLVLSTGGDTLRERSGDETMTTEDALGIGAQVARALAVAHSLGVSHDRLGPSAVAVDPEGVASLDFISPDTGEDGAVSQDDIACRPPSGEPAGPRADAYSLGALLRWLLDDKDVDSDVTLLIDRLVDEDPWTRPDLHELASQLAAKAGYENDSTRTLVFDSVTAPGVPAPPPRSREDPPPKERVGRFTLTRLLGRGASGVVCEGHDTSTGDKVAVKLLHTSRLDKKGRLRFAKEARILAELRHPAIARLLHADMDDEQTPFLAVEHVDGKSLGSILKDEGRLDPARAVRLIADAARGVAAAHAAGIVHRDLKPDNLMVQSPRGDDERVKVIDFGIARHVDESESLEMTRDGAVLGTPLYMAPEQAKGEDLDPRSDVYALGATLFHAICGRPPHAGSGAAEVLAQLLRDAAPAVADLRQDVPEAIAAVVDSALIKDRRQRFADARELLVALEGAVGSPPQHIDAHPASPAGPTDRVLRYSFDWTLTGTPAQLWPHVSKTDRVNRAIGLGAIDYETVKEDGDVRRYAQLNVAGMNLSWREHPYEWIEGRRLGILREFSQGPFLWFRSVVELQDNGDGTTRLVHSIDVEPRGVLGRAAAAMEIGRKAKKGLDRVYKRIGALVSGSLVADDGRRAIDAFEVPSRLSADGEQRLSQGEQALVGERGVAAEVVETLGDFLRVAPPQRVARIRPLELAREFGLHEGETLAGCLHAADLGLLEVRWDILCPACRLPSQLHDTLRALKEHGRCDACDLDFELDLGGSVELVFRVHPAVREADAGFYCIGGPGHSPHVVAQVRLAPGERFDLDLELEEGAYRLAGRELPFELGFRVVPGAPSARWDLSLGAEPPPDLPRALSPSGQRIEILNDTAVERVARVERAVARDDVVTAARAATLPLFRELFPGELLSDGQLVTVSWTTLLRVDIQDIDGLYDVAEEPRVFEALYRAWRDIGLAAAQAGGAMVKIDGDGALCTFPTGPAALKAARGITRALAVPRGLALRAVVTGAAGPALMVTIDDRLDYFGRATRALHRYVSEGKPGDIVLADEIAMDPGVDPEQLEGWLVEPVVLDDGGVAHVLRREGPPRVSDEGPDPADEITAPEVPNPRATHDEPTAES